MGRVRRDPKYIGSALRNDVEVGDEVCVHFEDGHYLNREVTDVHRMKPTEGEVTVGDPEGMHAILGWRIHEDAEAFGSREDWEVFAYELTDDPSDPADDLAEPDAFYIVGEGVRMPDITYEEAKERFEDKVRPAQELYDEMQDIIVAAQAVQSLAVEVENNELSLHDMEVRLDTLETKHGGRMPFE